MADSTNALSLLSAALSASDATTEAENLQSLYKVFQTQPGNIPLLLPSLVTLLGRAGESFKRWIVDVFDLAFCRPTLGTQGRAALAVHLPDALLELLSADDLRYAKVAICVFASVYQPLFRMVCTDRSQGKLWQTVEAIKRRIVQLFDIDGHMGIKLAALKAFQKIILVQTRPGDPKSAAYSMSSRTPTDAHLGLVPADHMILRLPALETEANERLTQVVTIIFTSSSPDLVMASMNTLATLAKYRQALSSIVFEALISWTPTALSTCSHTLIRSVEKTLQLLYYHFHPSRNAWSAQYASQIIEAVETQRVRMETAAGLDQARRTKEAASTSSAATGDHFVTTAKGKKRKRVRFVEEEAEAEQHEQQTTRKSPPPQPVASTSQVTLNADSSELDTTMSLDDGRKSADAFRQSSALSGTENPLAAFDVTTLPLNLVVDLILANLQALTDEDLHNAINRTRSNIDGVEAKQDIKPPGPPPVPVARPGPPPGPPPTFAASQVKKEADDEDDVQNPLNIDVGDEEVLAEAEKTLVEQQQGLLEGPSTSSALSAYTIRPPSTLKEEDCRAYLHDSVTRICDNGVKMKEISRNTEDNATNAQLWSMLVTRLATRGFTNGVHPTVRADSSSDNSAVTWRKQSDTIRQMMLDFVIVDFAGRMHFAVQWMAEEFYMSVKERKRGEVGGEEGSCYDEWLHRLVKSLGTTLDSKDRSLMDFLNQLPHIPETIIDTLETLCVDKAKMRIGFGMLREMAIHRIPSRSKIGRILLSLTKNEEKAVRSAAIITVRNWVRGSGNSSITEAGEELEGMVLQSANEALERLTVREADVPEEEGEREIIDEITPSALDDPAKEIRLETDVVRLVELPFALCVRVASMLDDIFAVYPRVSTQVQESIRKTIVPLIQTLGPNHARLLSLIRRHPPGSDSLAVCLFTVVTEKQKSKKVVDMVKEMAEEQTDIDPRFLIPILPDLTKAEIIKYLPRVITIMASEKPEDRATIKAVFTSIVTIPEQGFGSVSSNLPRVRSSELLTPVELMSLLHHSEREIGLKTTAEAIRICFGMTDIFRSEVLGAVLNLILEEPELPVLFMRTAIMAVRTYKSLAPRIATVFLSRLITKKVWQQPLLWDGFILCAKQTAPASFGALIQLPKDQLREVIAKQPDLKTGLREYLVKKAGGHKVRLKNFLELLGETPEEEAAANVDATSVPANHNHQVNGSAHLGNSPANDNHNNVSTPQSASL